MFINESTIEEVRAEFATFTGKPSATALAAMLRNACEMTNDGAVIKFLLEQGAKVNHKDDEEHAPLYWALRRNQCSKEHAEGLPALEALLAAGADVTGVADPPSGSTPIHMACHDSNGHVECVELLCRSGKLGATVNARDAEGRTPLMLLVAGFSEYGFPAEPAGRAITALLAAGADPTLTGEDKKPLIFWAAQRENGPAVVSALCASAKVDKEATFDDMGDQSHPLFVATQARWRVPRVLVDSIV